jgi:signal transduction histidine kinase
MLRPPRLEQEGLSRALQHLIHGITTGTGLQTRCQIQAPPYPLPCDIETNLLRIVQEATTNVLKHANASAIFVELTFNPKVIRLQVKDNGDGFDPDQLNGLGFGLIGIRERVQNLGGQLIITSQVGQGTDVIAIVPLAANLPGSSAEAS